MSNRRGRPPKPEGERAKDVFQIRLASAEKAAWREAAERASMPLSAWIRSRLNATAEIELHQE